MNKKCWYNKNGQFKCWPKDDGSGIMCSGYQSREYGFGLTLFQKHKDAVNTYRSGTHYNDEEAENTINKSPLKPPLTIDPFVRMLKYGNSEGKEGYWSYYHMIIQFEYFLDMLK